NPYLYGLAAVSANDVWAVGGANQTFTAHWDGSSWSTVPSPNPYGAGSGLRAVAAVATNDVWAVGQYDGIVLTEHWNGTSWNIVSSPGYSWLSGVAAVASNDIWAVGYRANGTLIVHYSDPC